MLDQVDLDQGGLQSRTFVVGDRFSWVHDASNPYWDWLWGSPSEALAQVRAWLGRPSSEISMNRIHCIADSKQVLGGFIALGGNELRQCRKADLLSLLSYAKHNHCDAFVARMRKATQLFSAVSEDDYYLSRVGVEFSARGRGLGKQLMKIYLEHGAARGFKRFRLDVAASNIQAINLYKAFGFTINSVTEAPDVPFQYCEMILTA